MVLTGRVLIPGQAQAAMIRLSAPLSFWGGVDPTSGRIIDTRHPQHGASLAGCVVAIPGLKGSSSASSVILELIYRRIAPAGLILGEVDAVLLLGVMAAIEMGWDGPPAVALEASLHRLLPDPVRITTDGRVLEPN